MKSVHSRVFTPARVLELVDELIDPDAPLSVLWVTVPTGRESFRQEIERLRGQKCVVPLVVRDDSFAVPNAAMADLVTLLERHRGEVEAGLGTGEAPRLIVILISATPLSIPQVASPATLPAWIPGVGGRETMVRIQDVTASAVGPVSARESDIDLVVQELFELESLVVGVLSRRFAANRRDLDPLLSLLRVDPREPFDDIISGFSEFLGTVTHAAAYRPSAKEGRSLVGRLLRVAGSRSPDQLGQVGKALAQALGVSGTCVVTEPLVAVLLRPTNRDADLAQRFGRSLIITAYAACQFATAAAHADDYSAYPLQLLQAVSRDLRRAMEGLDSTIRAVPSDQEATT